MPSSKCEMVTIGSDKSIDLSCVEAFHSPEFVSINKIFRKFNYELRVAGGAVRDILMKKEPKDIDLATTATPAQMIDMFTKEELRILNRNGESHGTVTVRINDKVNYEITTLRIDSNQDGRHANVSFTKDWQLDASRRDLTVNSMFIDVSFGDPGTNVPGDGVKHSIYGRLYDFFNGYNDLEHRRIRFVGEPSERIKEDYLRILRYFRFHARLSTDPDDHDEAALKAIAENSRGLEKVAGERIWMELRLILGYPSAPFLLRYMAETGVTKACGLPPKPNLAEVERLYAGGILHRHANPATCIAAALSSIDEVETLIQRIRPSNLEQNILYFLVEWRQSLAADGNIIERLQREYLLSLDQAPCFPLNGIAVTEKWGVKGRQLRPVLQGLRTIWVESGCTMAKEALLDEGVFQKVSRMPPEEVERSSMIPVKRQKRYPMKAVAVNLHGG
ncbi:CCA tRNA nucleotidyltransferase 1 mitochondrial [Taenia crassiceps]|uniref:CCA tRNA nucleotidyltransferase 1 mitochondrial n=1 Tax=Taenia crassiceps TaxID=6207 RepID=A0ABR4QKK7_9CEST